VLFSPRATFADVAAHPQWIGVLAVTIVIIAAGTFAFLSTEVGRQALLDQQTRMAESFGFKLSDAQYTAMESRLSIAPYTTAVFQVVFLPIVALVVAAIAFAVFTAFLGGDAVFRQVFAVVAHSGVVVALQTLFSMPLDYVRETLSSPTSLAVFAPFLDEASFLGRMLGSIDLFIVWWSITLAIGLAVVYKRKTGPIAMALLLLYAGIAVVIAAIRSALSGV
jgi:hypothetical protein